MEADIPQCQNRRCSQLIIILRGHRKRQYCDDTCKQAEHRARQADKERARKEEARQARLLRMRDQIRKKYGNLLPETLDLLLALPGHESWIAKVILAEREQACRSQAQERSDLIDEILLAGEELGFPRLKNDDFLLEEGLDSWLGHCNEADLATLYQTRDIVFIRREAQDARQRLVQLTPQS